MACGGIGESIWHRSRTEAVAEFVGLAGSMTRFKLLACCGQSSGEWLSKLAKNLRQSFG